tara:strand:+ start:384 stop:569 length:186 start_codon:yes stop_codon:yes gene_type:complete
MSRVKRKPRTNEQITDCKGLLAMRRDLTQVMNAARDGKEVLITEYGFDREPSALYKLVKIS